MLQALGLLNPRTEIYQRLTSHAPPYRNPLIASKPQLYIRHGQRSGATGHQRRTRGGLEAEKSSEGNPELLGLQEAKDEVLI